MKLNDQLYTRSVVHSSFNTVQCNTMVVQCFLRLWRELVTSEHGLEASKNNNSRSIPNVWWVWNVWLFRRQRGKKMPLSCISGLLRCWYYTHTGRQSVRPTQLFSSGFFLYCEFQAKRHQCYFPHFPQRVRLGCALSNTKWWFQTMCACD